jgi:ubiquinone/menaquinone biosynthesis C-methylase UbiE
MSKFDASDHKNNWTDRDVEMHWDSVSSIYISENNKVKNAHDQRFTESLKHLQTETAQRVLNISSRDAEADSFLKKANPKLHIVNVEISQGLINEAHKVNPDARQIKVDTYSKLPFENAFFDRILSLETLEHAADPIAFLNELHRVSTQNAIMVLSCPPATSEIPYQIFTSIFGGHGEGPHRFLSSEEVKVMFRKTNWKLLLHKGTVLIPVGPQPVQQFGERLINAFQGSLLAECGIRQFYVCEKY